MKNEKLAKIKRSICRLDWQEFNELEKWLRKRREIMWKTERLKRKREHEESIKALPKGALVTPTDSRYEICGKVGRVVRHLERNSTRTVVDFGKEGGIWRIPRSQLSANVSENRINQLKMSKNLSGILNKALSKIEVK